MAFSNPLRRPRPWALLCALGLAATLGACGGDSDDAPPGDIQLRTLSNRADLVSGGDVLAEVVPANGSADGLNVTLNGADVTAAFAKRADGRITGLVTGLTVGQNTLKATTSGSRTATLAITNAPRGGPVLSSTQLLPFVCATAAPTVGTGATASTNASGLTTAATDAQCNIATEFKLFYRTLTPLSATAGDGGCSFVLPDPSPAVGSPAPAPTPANSCLQPYVAGTTPASLVASTTTTAGTKIPYIVRVERGTINRGVYDIAVLFDPTAPAWTATAPQPQWNRKVVYSFGSGTGFPRLQNRSTQNWADNDALSRGFMVVDNSMTDSSQNGNRYLVAETALMMKEHIIDRYGELLFMMGNGASGGAINQMSIASTLPGVIDGAQLNVEFADSESTLMEVFDCTKLVAFYQSPDWLALQAGLTPAQINAKKTAINGHLDQTACHGWFTLFAGLLKPGNYTPMGVLDNSTGAMLPIGAPTNNCKLPASLVYDAATNPNGTRCGNSDIAAGVWGTTANTLAPGATRALSNMDNVGIQYGLKALLAGRITPEEFVTLNEKIGGFDTDGNASAARAAADADSLPIAYRAGLVSSGKNLAKVATIDLRAYDEVYGNLALAEYGVHQYWRSYSHRARLDAENAGAHGNQSIWRLGKVNAVLTPPIVLDSLLAMDTWLSSLATTSPKAWVNAERTQAQVAAARPTSAADFCYLSTDTTQSTRVFDAAICDADANLRPHASPRQVAGGPLAENVLKCQLKPLAQGDYAPVAFTAGQWNRLLAAFSLGVCDWSKPGIGQVETVAPMTFRPGAGTAGKPLGAAPVSSS